MPNQLDKRKTFIDELHIQKFRAFENVDFSIGKNLTMISGINGTGKSTILGILAQICSFDKDYVPDENGNPVITDVSNYKTVFNRPFESNFKNHFKISNKYDLPKVDNYVVDFKINDAGEQRYTSAELRGTHRKNLLRLVLRKDKTIANNSSRNVTLPTVYLSLRRLTPYVNRKENIPSFKLSSTEKHDLVSITNNIFTPTERLEHVSSNEDGKSGVSSSVATNENYDIQSASTGEDNLGQIVSSMLSFSRLKDNWPNYHGGLLLIDELDASIFPYAQKTLLRELNKFSSKLNVQIVFTTHSPIIMKQMIDLKDQSKLNTKTAQNYGINFISNEFGKPENHSNFSLEEMMARLNIDDIVSPSSDKTTCYCEDSEAYYFLNSLLTPKVKKNVSMLKTIKLGGEQLIELRKHKIPEFTYKSLIVLDGDKHMPNGYKNFCQFPSSMAPDQLIYTLLNQLPADDEYWKLDVNWNKTKFLNDPYCHAIANNLIFDSSTNTYKVAEGARISKPIREYFKEWYNHNIDKFRRAQLNPIKQLWMPNNLDQVSKFRDEFEEALNYVSSFK